MIARMIDQLRDDKQVVIGRGLDTVTEKHLELFVAFFKFQRDESNFENAATVRYCII